MIHVLESKGTTTEGMQSHQAWWTALNVVELAEQEIARGEAEGVDVEIIWSHKVGESRKGLTVMRYPGPFQWEMLTVLWQ